MRTAVGAESLSQEVGFDLRFYCPTSPEPEPEFEKFSMRDLVHQEVSPDER